ncbi:magnesium transporter NIPA-domain-containing protein [Crepidotus variabilis]|uniref:Magnesium transporter NIPA-domain-containing protein n=1 Tax=Crepidotus variabilis TaxID=179855 RepID=A0A9P6JJP0_9AGAR|nr:magnesium transporter NIPA-domain-containing protein [Crepidotus variabilis]
MSSSASSTSTSAAAASSSGAHSVKVGGNLKVVGIILAIASGLLIGSSFVFKKKGLIRSQAGGELGEGVAYLKSVLWWTGMSMMILGELCNFAAYAFVEAVVVTPLGALSVVICAILSSFFLNERLSFFGWLGCGLCILGSVIIALNGPQEQTVGQIREFQKLFLAPGFLAYISVLIVASLVIIFYFAPKYGKKSMLWYISVCSMIGGISVSVTTGLGAAIVETAFGDNQFKYWFMYFLFAFVVITLLVEVYYLNVALALFNTAMVTPTYYVIFTFFSLVTTVVLFQGLKASAAQIITIVMAFLVICFGITILQMSKVDPVKLQKLDRRSTMLLQAAREHAGGNDEKAELGIEDPGMDTLRGSFGAVGSIIRARTVRRMSQSSGHSNSQLRTRPAGAAAPYVAGTPSWMSADAHGLGGLQRHQLYDAPVPRADDAESIHSHLVNKRPTIKFDEQDLVHSYSRPGAGDNKAHHEHRLAHGLSNDGYPPLPPLPQRDTVVSMAATDGNLLEMESPELAKKIPSAIRGDSDAPAPQLKLTSPGDQTLILPPLLGSESESHSAPPTIYSRFAKSGGQMSPTTQQKSLRNFFDKSNTSSGTSTPRASGMTERGTLLSFPSVTDSAPSEWGDDDASTKAKSKSRESLGVVTKDKEKERSRERSRPRTPKKYPGAVEDDKEETESLWHKNSLSLSTEEGSGESGESAGPPPEAGSIRLVQTSNLK